MVLALKWPDLIKDIVSVDNSPIDATLQSSFGKYVQGMKEIDNANVTKQSEADKILEKYEKVRYPQLELRMDDTRTKLSLAITNPPVPPGKPQ